MTSPPPTPLSQKAVQRSSGCCMRTDPHATDDCRRCQSYGDSPQQLIAGCHTSAEACADCHPSSAGLFCRPPPLSACEQMGVKIVEESSWKDHLQRDVAQMWMAVPSWSAKAEVRISFPQVDKAAGLVVQNIEGAVLKASPAGEYMYDAELTHSTPLAASWKEGAAIGKPRWHHLPVLRTLEPSHDW